MFKEFKEFAMRGNVLDLAVGVIIGAAFGAIVTSFVNDIVMPIIGLFTGGMDYTNWFIALDGGSYETLEAAKTAGAATINFGVFLGTLINFVIIAFVIFMIVRAANKMKKPAPAAAPATQECPFCASTISAKALRCPHCTSQL